MAASTRFSDMSISNWGTSQSAVGCALNRCRGQTCHPCSQRPFPTVGSGTNNGGEDLLPHQELTLVESEGWSSSGGEVVIIDAGSGSTLVVEMTMVHIGGVVVVVVVALAVVDGKSISWEGVNVAAATPGEEDLSRTPNTPYETPETSQELREVPRGLQWWTYTTEELSMYNGNHYIK